MGSILLRSDFVAFNVKEGVRRIRVNRASHRREMEDGKALDLSLVFHPSAFIENPVNPIHNTTRFGVGMEKGRVSITFFEPPDSGLLAPVGFLMLEAVVEVCFGL